MFLLAYPALISSDIRYKQFEKHTAGGDQVSDPVGSVVEGELSSYESKNPGC